MKAVLLFFALISTTECFAKIRIGDQLTYSWYKSIPSHPRTTVFDVVQRVLDISGSSLQIKQKLYADGDLFDESTYIQSLDNVLSDEALNSILQNCSQHQGEAAEISFQGKKLKICTRTEVTGEVVKRITYADVPFGFYKKTETSPDYVFKTVLQDFKAGN